MNIQDAQTNLEKMVRGLRFTTIESIEMLNNNIDARIKIKTKCNDLYFEDFEETIFDCANTVNSEFLHYLKTKYFLNNEYQGIIIRDKIAFDVSILDAVEIVNKSIDESVEESTFIKVINLALSNDFKTDVNKLKWKGSARQLGYIISVLASNYNLIEVSPLGEEINSTKLAQQILGSFNIKCTEQTLRKSIDQDNNKLTKNEKLELMNQIKEIVEKSLKV